jgi:hypothetical protein
MSATPPHDQPIYEMVEGLGAGQLIPESAVQSHAILAFDRKSPPRDERGRPVFAVRASDHAPVCGSKKSGGGHCLQTARYPNGRCRLHGGPSLKGPASRTWRDGRRSRYLPPAVLLDRYREGLEDPELTHHRHSTALVDAMVDDLLKSYEAGVGPELWREVERVYGKMVVANNSGDTPRAREAYEELGYIIDRGAQNSRVPERVMRALNERRKHAESETKRKLSEAMVFSVEEATMFYASLAGAVRKFVTDRETQDAILNELSAIGGRASVDGAAIERAAGPTRALPPGPDPAHD